MLWILFTILLLLGGTIAFVIGRGSDPAKGQNRAGPFGIAALCLVVWLILTGAMSLYTVGQREVGILYNFSGTIAGKKDAGFGFHAPWQHLKKENVGIQSQEFDLDPGNAAVSQDQQPIYARVFVNFQVLPGDVVGLYKNVGPAWKHILLDARVLQDVKEVTALYQTPEVTTHRENLRSQIRERLTKELARYDVRIVDVFLKNIGFAPSYTAAVEAKQVQVQQSLQAQAKVDQSKAEARQKIAQANGEATAIYLKGKALRNNPEILRLEAIDKLNPNAQVIICTGKTCPSFLPSGLVGK